MDKEQRVRRAVAGLEGKEREAAKLRLLGADPEEMEKLSGKLIRSSLSKSYRPSLSKGVRDILFTVRLSDEEYLQLRRSARRRGVTMSECLRELFCWWRKEVKGE